MIKLNSVKIRIFPIEDCFGIFNKVKRLSKIRELFISTHFQRRYNIGNLNVISLLMKNSLF